MPKVHEVCSCGASFDFTARLIEGDSLLYIVNDWRAKHPCPNRKGDGRDR